MSNGLLNQLVAYWKCEEVSGTRVDSHTGGYDMLETGSVTSTTGKDGTGLNPSTDTANHLDGTTGGPFGFGDASFSINGWMRVGSGAEVVNHPMVAKFDSSGAPDVDDSWLLWFRTTNDEFRFSISSDGTSEETIVETTDFAVSASFQMVSAGYNAADNEIWIARNNGTRVTAAHTGGAFAGSVAPITLGWFQGSSPVMGSEPVDEVGIWSRYLTDADLDDLWAGGSGLFFDSFVGGTSSANGLQQKSASYYYKRGVIL
jgi:hypothetical protein